MQNIFSFILDFWVEIWHVFTMIHLYFEEVSTIAGSLTCSLYLKVIAAAYSWPTSGSTGPWIALLASQSLPSSTEILVCNVIRQFFFVPPVWQWHTVQWFSGVCILSTRSCRKNTCCSESWDNYSDLETILRSLKVYSSVFPPPTHTCHADLRSGAVISQPKWTGASWEDNRSFLSPFHLIVWDFKDLLAGGSENAFSLTSNMVCVGVCCVRGCVFIFLLPPAVQCFSPTPMAVFAWRVWCTLAMCLLKPLSFFFPFLYEGGSSSGCKPPSSTLCQPAALGFSPAEPTMSSQHSHPSFGNIHSMADQQQVPETCFLGIKFYDITHM